jgi:serpin B
VRLPKMRIEQSHDLLDLLAGLGLPIEGDYSGPGSEDLFVSAVVQKTFLELDEDGTEAAPRPASRSRSRPSRWRRRTS